jgi:dephospho-CoA kinase
MASNDPKLICVTGGVASGKSTFAMLLASTIHAEIFNADEAVHSLLACNIGVMEAVRQRFPSAWKDGALDRKELGRFIFRDPASRLFLEELLHPRVYDLCDQAWKSALNQNKSLVAEIPLLFESKAQARFPLVILVAASPCIQLQRLQEYRKLDVQRAEAVLVAQWPNEQKIPGAHIVIWNDGSLRMLEEQMLEVAKRHCLVPMESAPRPGD